MNDQIKSLVAEKRNYKPTKGKEPGITKEQAIEELKVFHWLQTVLLQASIQAWYFDSQSCVGPRGNGSYSQVFKSK